MFLQVSSLTTGVNEFTGGTGNDSFTAGTTTIQGLDVLAGGEGTDTFLLSDTGAADYAMPTFKATGIEKVSVTNEAASAGSTGSKEKAVVTVGALKNGQTLTVAGQTLLATKDLTAAEVAAALATADVTGANEVSSPAGDWVLSGDLSASYIKAAGTNTDEVVYTAAAVGNSANLAVTGNSVANAPQVNILTLGNAGTVDTSDVYSVVVNGQTVTAAAIAAATTASAASAVATAINAYLGKNIATSIGSTIQVISSDPISIGTFTDPTTGPGQTATTMANALAPSVQTIDMGGTPASTPAALTFTMNGKAITTAVPTANTTAAAATAVANAINAEYGAVIATVGNDSTPTPVVDKITIDSGVLGLAISNPAQAGGSLSNTLATTTTSNGLLTTDAPVIAITDGSAAVAASKYTTTVGGGTFTGATDFINDKSTANVAFTGLKAGQTVTVQADGLMTHGTTSAAYGATVTSADLVIDGGTKGGAITLTGTGISSATITSQGAALTSTGKLGTNTTGAISAFEDAISTQGTLTINADSNLTIVGGLSTDAETLTLKGAGSVAIYNSTATAAAAVGGAGNLDTIDASGLTGATGVTLQLNSGTLAFTGSEGADTVSTEALGVTAAINGGGGLDSLVITDLTDLDTVAEGAKYSNFEVIYVPGNFAASLVPSAVSHVLLAAGSISGLTATQAASQTIATGAGAATASYALANSTGKADVLGLTLAASAAKVTTSLATSLTANGFETINIGNSVSSSAAPGTASTSTIGNIIADKVTSIVLTGTAFTLGDISNTTLPVSIDASALTGDRATTDPKGLTTTGNATTGSVITGSDYNDTFNIGAEGQTFNGGDGDDTFVIGSTDPAALLAADGTTDLVVSGGADTASVTAGRDVLRISDSTATDAVTLTDANFTYVSGMEELNFTNTGNLSLTIGGSFNQAFADGARITNTAQVDAKTYTINGGLASSSLDVRLTGTNLVGNGAGEDITITTGSANDKVTVTAAAFTGAGSNADGGSITISTKDGDDVISVTTGTLLAQITSEAIQITGGKGADKITIVKANGTAGTNPAPSTDVKSQADFIIAEGDSIFGTHDTITGFDAGITSGSKLSDLLDFEGTGAVSDFSNSNDYGVIKSHSLSGGLVKFDDVGSYTEELIISSSNVADVIGYLNLNTDDADVVAFQYDSNGDGVSDNTIVYHNGVVTDSAVELVGVLLAGLNSTITTTTDNVAVIA